MSMSADTGQHLSAFWVSWCVEQGIMPQSADEVALGDLTAAQREVVEKFIALWDAVS